MSAQPARTRTQPVNLVMTALVVLAWAYFAIKGWDKATRPRGSDFTIYYDAGRAWLAGTNPLTVAEYIYPPVCALFLSVFALFPYAVAAALWQALGFVALLRTWRLTLCINTGCERPGWLLWLPALCLLRLVDSNFGNGQINLFILWLVTEALWQLQRGRPQRAALWLGGAAALKVLPVVLFLKLLVARQWRALATGLATIAAIVLLLPIPFLGLAQHEESLRDFWSEVVAPYRAGGDELLAERPYIAGQSMTAVAYRLLSNTPGSVDVDDGPRANLLELELDVTARLLTVAFGVLIALTAITLLRAPERGFDARAALVVCLALLLGPLVHKAHLVWLLLPFTVLLERAARRSSCPARYVRNAFFAAALFLIACTTPTIVGRATATWLNAHGVLFFGLAATYAALLVECWWPTANTAAGSEALVSAPATST